MSFILREISRASFFNLPDPGIWETPGYDHTARAGLGGVVVGSLISWSVQARLLGQRIAADKELAERKRSDELQLAERKFDYERDLHAHKRRAELAEQVLMDFYRFADLIREVRRRAGAGSCDWELEWSVDEKDHRS